MAASPKYKCYDHHGVYQASVKDLVLAGAIMAVLGYGATVRIGHRKQDCIYQEGMCGDSGVSYDAVASWALNQKQIW